MDETTKVILERMDRDISEIRTDVRALLQFKWQILTLGIACSVVVSFVVQFILILIEKKA